MAELCNECGQPLPERAKFCAECGMAVARAEPPEGAVGESAEAVDDSGDTGPPAPFRTSDGREPPERWNPVDENWNPVSVGVVAVGAVVAVVLVAMAVVWFTGQQREAADAQRRVMQLQVSEAVEANKDRLGFGEPGEWSIAMRADPADPGSTMTFVFDGETETVFIDGEPLSTFDNPRL